MISNVGFNEGFITLYVTEDTKQNDIITVSANNTCTTSSEGEKFCGVVKGVRNGIGTIQVKGYVELTYSGTVNLGKVNLVADGMGGVKEATEGVPALVTVVDTVASKIKVII